MWPHGSCIMEHQAAIAGDTILATLSFRSEVYCHLKVRYWYDSFTGGQSSNELK